MLSDNCVDFGIGTPSESLLSVGFVGLSWSLSLILKYVDK